EIGMLRAVGMTRRQTRRMIRHESIVTSLIGAALGIVVGFFLAILVTHALSSEGIVFAVPYLSLVYFVIAAIVVGIVAAIWPARACMIVRESLDVIVERVLRGGGDDPGLAHRSAEEELARPRLLDALPRAGEDGTEGTAEAFREADRHGVRQAPVLGRREPRC